jgi:hypothetical protein
MNPNPVPATTRTPVRIRKSARFFARKNLLTFTSLLNWTHSFPAAVARLRPVSLTVGRPPGALAGRIKRPHGSCICKYPPAQDSYLAFIFSHLLTAGVFETRRARMVRIYADFVFFCPPGIGRLGRF